MLDLGVGSPILIPTDGGGPVSGDSGGSRVH